MRGEREGMARRERDGQRQKDRVCITDWDSLKNDGENLESKRKILCKA
jgi:hypothetical protein